MHAKMASPLRRLHIFWLWVIQSICYALALTFLFVGWPLGLFVGIGAAIFRVYVLGEIFGSLGRPNLVSFDPRFSNAFTFLVAMVDATLVVLSACMFDGQWAKRQGLGPLAFVAPMVLMPVSSIVIALLCGPRQPTSTVP
ncbi:MAG: hypothetical protein ACTS27_04140 [Phycisphaerales bacterium]